MDIKNLNKILSGLDDELTKEFEGMDYPITFILALPRGASALLTQIMLTMLSVGYIDNVLAKFWQAPFIGSVISDSLRNTNYISNLESNFGNTEGLFEPHEWGWFWKKHLKITGDDFYIGCEADIEVDHLKSKFSAMDSIISKPIVIDNVFAVANIEFLKNVFPNCNVIYISRNPYYVANSIINARLSKYNDISQFYGQQPRNKQALKVLKNPYEQVVYQVSELQLQIENSLNLFAEDKKIHITYEDLVMDVHGVVFRLQEFLNKQGGKVQFVDRDSNIKLESRNNLKLVDTKTKNMLDFYFPKYFGSQRFI